jgi:hypothetical protein
VAYQLTCDNAACGEEIEAGEGQPTLMSRRKLYCKACSGVMAQVEIEVRKQATQKAMKLAGEIDSLREDLLRKMLPPQKGGTGEGFTEWPTVG